MPQRPLEARDAVAAPKRADAAFGDAVAIRPASLDDVPEIVAVINAAYLPRDGWLFGGALRTSEDDVRGEMADAHRFFVAEVDGAIAGSIRLANRTFGLLATAPHMQGRGIAPMLIAHVEEIARSEGLPVLGLDCVAEIGMPAYYEALGYRVVREEPGGRKWDATQDWTHVFMEKQL
jgi:predicted N-acetyltransferase YhbS